QPSPPPALSPYAAQASTRSKGWTGLKSVALSDPKPMGWGPRMQHSTPTWRRAPGAGSDPHGRAVLVLAAAARSRKYRRERDQPRPEFLGGERGLERRRAELPAQTRRRRAGGQRHRETGEVVHGACALVHVHEPRHCAPNGGPPRV